MGGSIGHPTAMLDALHSDWRPSPLERRVHLDDWSCIIHRGPSPIGFIWDGLLASRYLEADRRWGTSLWCCGTRHNSLCHVRHSSPT